jgi:hypothetical protein
MITCVCPHCDGQWAVAEEMAGHDVSCPTCGGRTAAPIDLAFEDEPAAPGTVTLTMAELQAIRASLRQ